MARTLDVETGSRLARAALGHLGREFPNKLDHVMGGPEDAAAPRALHPLFYGSFDWHSCVHGWWCVARLARRLPDVPERVEIERRLDEAFSAEAVAGELAYLARPGARGFERPYGWAWALRLGEELALREDENGRRRSDVYAPLARAFAERFRSFLPLAAYPVRAGAHGNTAFALTLALDYARARSDAELERLACASLIDWHGGDVACQAWEPSQDDFLSPALTEAVAMLRALGPQGFRTWFAAFLPDAGRGAPTTLFAPVAPSDRSDGKIAHLDGLNLSRAWAWREIAAVLDRADPTRGRALATADAHLEAALPHVTGDYMGEHWLATYALLALEAPAGD